MSHVGIVLQSRLIVDGEPEGRVFNQVMEATDSGVKNELKLTEHAMLNCADEKKSLRILESRKS